MKSQISFPLKVSVVVLSIAAFMLVIYYYTSFTSTVKEEKTKTQFRAEVLNTLEKLVESDKCLAYSGFVNSSKPVLDINKIKEFVSKYKDIEPDCAKALDFDYSVEIIQPPKEIKTYPGEVLKQTECGETEVGFAFHGEDKNLIKTHYLYCKNLDKESFESCCKSSTGVELDMKKIPGILGGYRVCHGNTPPCGNDPKYMCTTYDCSQYVIDTIKEDGTVDDEKLAECQEKISKGEKVCCIFTNCISGTGHDIVIKCYNLDPEKDCTENPYNAACFHYFHTWCGSVAVPVKVPTTKTIQSSIQQKIWSFSVSSGISSFSPEKAKWDEMEISHPVIIRYNSTFSVEGIIKIKAVRGELEKFVSLLEDACKKAESGEKVYFAEKMHFSFDVKKEGDKICMLDKCKIFSCSIPLEIPEKIGKGERYIKITYDTSSGKIKVIT